MLVEEVLFGKQLLQPNTTFVILCQLALAFRDTPVYHIGEDRDIQCAVQRGNCSDMQKQQMPPAGAEKGYTARLFLRCTFGLKLGLIYWSFECVERLAVAGEERTSCRGHTCAEWGVPPEWLLLVTFWGSFLYQVHKLYCSLVITRGLQRLGWACGVISWAEKFVDSRLLLHK